MQQVIGEIKKAEGDCALCFGHLQKMFNIAVKLYFCLYMSRKELGIENLFYEDLTDCFQFADCPIDSIILNKLDKKIANEELDKFASKVKCEKIKKFSDLRWSKFTFTKSNDEKNAYEIVQDAISTLSSNRLAFDFEEWNIS